MIEPKIVTMPSPLPYGRDWNWYPELNIVTLADHLDCAGRERAIDELQAEWRASVSRHLRAVPAQPQAIRPPPASVLVPLYDLPVSVV